MEFHEKNKRIAVTLSLVFAVMVFVMFIYELTKQLLNPSITIWGSHIVTILFTSIVSVVILFFPLRSLYREQEKTKAALILQQETEKVLRDSEKRYQSLYDEAPIAYFSVRLDGVIHQSNEKSVQIMGIPAEKLTGMKFVDLYADAPKGKERVKTVLSRSLSGENINDEEVLMKHEDGTLHCVSLSLNVVYDSAGNMTEIRAVVIDVNERTKAKEALRTVNKKLNLLSSITRHDIINQVSAAEIFVELVEIEGEIPQGSKIADDLDNIAGALKTIERQIVFTRDYQDLGVQSPDWQRVGRIIDETAPTISKDLRLINEAGTLEIYADPLFEKVIYNLFDNAVRYGEKITTIRFFSEKSPDGLKLICEDDGVGVPADVKKKIFNRQYYKHTGLGLFLSQEILSITGMTIAETGVPGEGARFEISVPTGMWRLE